MSNTLATIINNLLSLNCIAVVAKRLEIVDRVRAAKTEGDDVIHRHRSLVPTRGAATFRRILLQYSFPLCPRASTFGRPLACLITLMSDAVGFRMSGPIGANDLIASATMIPAPLCRKRIKAVAVVRAISALLLAHELRVIFAKALVTLTFSFRVLRYVSTLVGGTTRSALTLFAIGVTSIGREFVYGFDNFALGAGFVDNRHRSISITDWAMPRLLQQRVAFAFRVFYPRALGATR